MADDQPSRASAPPPPPLAQQLFGSALPRAELYADILAGRGVVHGVIGPREAPRLWERHLLNSLAPLELLPDGSDLIDLGSGAGLPGIPLAIARPDLAVVLLEPLERRIRFLNEAVAALELSNVAVVRGRAEGGVVPSAAVVVARAVAPLRRLWEMSRPLLTAQGRLLALKGQTVYAEVDAVRQAQPELRIEVSAVSWDDNTRIAVIDSGGAQSHVTTPLSGSRRPSRPDSDHGRRRA